LIAYFGVRSVGWLVDVEFFGGQWWNFRSEGDHELLETGLYFRECAGCKVGTYGEERLGRCNGCVGVSVAVGGGGAEYGSQLFVGIFAFGLFLLGRGFHGVDATYTVGDSDDTEGDEPTASNSFDSNHRGERLKKMFVKFKLVNLTERFAVSRYHQVQALSQFS
jgi:hypothetical protein